MSGVEEFFFANQVTACSGCGEEIWHDDTVHSDGRGGLLHEDCEVPGA